MQVDQVTWFVFMNEDLGKCSTPVADLVMVDEADTRKAILTAANRGKSLARGSNFSFIVLSLLFNTGSLVSFKKK